MKTPRALLLVCLVATSLSLRAAIIFVSPDGKAGAAGTTEAPLATLNAAAERAQPGDTIRVAAGTYASAEPVRLVRSGTEAQRIRVEAAPGARPLFDFSAQEFRTRLSGINVQGDYWQVVGLEVIGAACNGIRVTGHHNIVERCVTHANQDSGIQLSAPASYNLVLDCDSYRNVDRPTVGENADGFAAKFEIGPGNVFRGCRAWENADDGFDLWRAPHPVRIENSVAFRNGIDLWGIPGYTGNGNGFKLGGDYVVANHVVINCVATDQPARAFDQNNNMGALTIENCTATRSKFGFAFVRPPNSGHHVLRNNLAFDAPVRVVEGTVLTDNLWLGADGAPVAPTISPPPPPGTPKRPATKAK